MSPKDADGLANSVDPDQTRSLIWAYTVCPDLLVQILGSIWLNIGKIPTSQISSPLVLLKTTFTLGSITFSDV